MALSDVSVHVSPLLHTRRTVGALDLGLLPTLELGVPLQVPRVYVTLRAPGARVPLDVPQTAGSSPPSAQRLVFLVIEVLRVFHHHRAQALQVRLELDPLHIYKTR